MTTYKNNNQVVEIYIPSELGYEKIVMALVATTAKNLGFSEEKIEDLKTALAEACTNAIEHGNSFKAQTKVLIVLATDAHSLKVSVIDEGHKPLPSQPPDRSKRDDFRGMGLFLIKSLMDKVEISSQPGRNEIRMTSYLRSPHMSL